MQLQFTLKRKYRFTNYSTDKNQFKNQKPSQFALLAILELITSKIKVVRHTILYLMQKVTYLE
jgi:hypothetical protein